MAQSSPSMKEIREAVTALGLKLSADELRALQNKEVVSLESKPLSQFGKLLAEAETLYKEENPRKVMSYAEMKERLTAKPRLAASSSGCRGVKVIKLGQRCGIYVHWPPAVSLCCTF